MPPSGEVRNSLAEGTPAFRPWTKDELPTDWRQAVARPGYGSHFFVAVELPDTHWGRCYYAWAIRELERLPRNSNALPVMVSSMFDFPAHFATVMEEQR